MKCGERQGRWNCANYPGSTNLDTDSTASHYPDNHETFRESFGALVNPIIRDLIASFDVTDLPDSIAIRHIHPCFVQCCSIFRSGTGQVFLVELPGIRCTVFHVERGVNQNEYLNIDFSVRRFVWIGSDAWGGRSNVVHRLELVVEGAISVSPLVRPLAGFDEYFTSLTPLEAAEHNPWFAEFWEEHFQCELPEQPDTPFSEKYPRWCSSSKRLSAASGYRQVPSLHFVRDAVYAFAYALHNMHADKCGGKPGLCEELRSIEGQELRKYIEKINKEKPYYQFAKI
ncbi:hypothetical protein LAZ67_21001718 [Cordylochernes scorpioides]|uniref:Receptor ligand binding region domain-containing protein n=1 Tax=Cordylochernes scorpioides TaxID=51811 RepID=A0ABY6LMI6_9ARAC|nr:hypothetical protein LAZ67_21001718 [Cordylochernes scorpioides]